MYTTLERSDSMARCCVCGDSFKLREVRSEFDSRFPSDMSYDELYPNHDYCLDCAISDTESLMSQGAAIDMVNGDISYDDDFVKKWL